MAALRAAAGALGRAVHVRIQPRPENLAESREVLRILERFGEVVYFKNLRYENHDPAPNTILAIYAKDTDAAKFLDASPLFFTLEPLAEHSTALPPGDEVALASEFDSKMEIGKEGAEEMVAPGRFANPASLDDDFSSKGSNKDSTSSDPFPLREQPKPQPREFRLVADLSQLHHRTYINRQPFHGPFKVKTKSLVQEDLAKTVPLIGLSDVDMWRPEVPSRVVRAAQAESRLSLRRVWEIGMGQRPSGEKSVGGGEAKEILERMKLKAKRRTAVKEEITMRPE